MHRKILQVELTCLGLFLALASQAQPVITSQPTNQSVLANVTNTGLSVAATGVGLFSYQWTLNGTNLPNNIITTIGIGGGFAGDGGAATNARFNAPAAIVSDANNNIFIADTMNSRIRKIGTNGIINTIAGTGIQGYTGDGGAATSARIGTPYGIAVDAGGNVFFADFYPGGGPGSRIRRISTNGIISTVVGTNASSYAGDGGLATSAQIRLTSVGGPCSLCFDGGGSLYIADYGNNRVRKVSTNGFIVTIAGNGSTSYAGDGSFATNSGLSSGVNSVFVDNNGNILISTTTEIYKVDTNNVIIKIAGGGASLVDGALATNSWIFPTGLLTDTSGNIYFGDSRDTRRGVHKIDTNGILTTIAGIGTSANNGDGGPATNAAMGCPYSIAFDGNKNLLIADELWHVVRKVWFAGLPSIALKKLSPTMQGNYQVVVSNSGGSVTSAVAALSVSYPAISSFIFTNPSSRFTIQWPVFQPSTFQVQWTTNLATGSWLNIGSTVTYSGTTNTVRALNDFSWVNYQQGFYRLVWLQ